MTSKAKAKKLNTSKSDKEKSLERKVNRIEEKENELSIDSYLDELQILHKKYGIKEVELESIILEYPHTKEYHIKFYGITGLK
jgi:hypothetical protein